MCEQLSIIGQIKVASFRRKSEMICADVNVATYCHDCDQHGRAEITVAVPCYAARKSNEAARDHLAGILRNYLVRMFGPISDQRFVEAVSDRAAQTDFKTLAGEMFLIDQPAKGRA
jgi:hypothetical protein